MWMRASIMILAITALFAGAWAMAEDDDKVMGLYQGGFDGGWEGRTLRVQVVAESKIAHNAVLFIGQPGKDEVRVEIKGKSRPGKSAFEGEVDLGAMGGKATITGNIADETFTGVVKTKKEVKFTLKRSFPEPPTRGQKPPEGAVSLFDGANAEQVWTRDPLVWCIQDDGSMQVCGSSLRTKEPLGGGLYHIEFMTPFMPNERYQGRGNSGVYVLGRYEVQVLDSFGVVPAWDLCGGIYKQAIPKADAVLPPLQWQTYDITFTPAAFDASGAKTANARINVVHNGVTIHDNIELTAPTPGGVDDKDAAAGPLMLQDHGNQVRYRNIWFVPAK